MPGVQDWWNSVVNGWNDFWSKVGSAIDTHNQTQNGGYMAIAEQPGGIQQIMEDIASPHVGAESVDPISGDTTDTGNIDSAFTDALDGSVSASDYLRNNPDSTGEDLLRFMAEQSDEWTEKWMDYVLEKQSIEDQNAYTASREDTAYQRLVEDLKSAGLNPAMMYGSSASPSSGGSVGVVKASEGANSRQLSNYEKLKSLLLAYMTYSLKVSQTIIGGSSNILGSIMKLI